MCCWVAGLGVTVKGSSLLIYIVLIYLLSRRHPSADEEMVATKLRDDDTLQQGSAPDGHQAVMEAVTT